MIESETKESAFLRGGEEEGEGEERSKELFEVKVEISGSDAGGEKRKGGEKRERGEGRGREEKGREFFWGGGGRREGKEPEKEHWVIA